MAEKKSKAKITAEWDEATEKKLEEKISEWSKKCGKNSGSAGAGAVYVMGLVGALIYFMQNAESFRDVIFGIAKSLFWPAFIIYRVLETLGF